MAVPQGIADHLKNSDFFLNNVHEISVEPGPRAGGWPGMAETKSIIGANNYLCPKFLDLD